MAMAPQGFILTCSGGLSQEAVDRLARRGIARRERRPLAGPQQFWFEGISGELSVESVTAELEIVGVDRSRVQIHPAITGDDL